MSRRPKMHIKVSQAEMIRQAENRKMKFVKEFPVRTLKLFAGFLLFIPLTAIAFGVHCFQANEWPWSDKI